MGCGSHRSSTVKSSQCQVMGPTLQTLIPDGNTANNLGCMHNATLLWTGTLPPIVAASDPESAFRLQPRAVQSP